MTPNTTCTHSPAWLKYPLPSIHLLSTPLLLLSLSCKLLPIALLIGRKGTSFLRFWYKFFYFFLLKPRKGGRRVSKGHFWWISDYPLKNGRRRRGNKNRLRTEARQPIVILTKQITAKKRTVILFGDHMLKSFPFKSPLFLFCSIWVFRKQSNLIKNRRREPSHLASSWGAPKHTLTMAKW